MVVTQTVPLHLAALVVTKASTTPVRTIHLILALVMTTVMMKMMATTEMEMEMVTTSETEAMVEGIR